MEEDYRIREKKQWNEVAIKSSHQWKNTFMFRWDAVNVYMLRVLHTKTTMLKDNSNACLHDLNALRKQYWFRGYV